jgi:hypothetical protein
LLLEEYSQEHLENDRRNASYHSLPIETFIGHMIRMEGVPKGMIQKSQEFQARNMGITAKASGMDTLAKRDFRQGSYSKVPPHIDWLPALDEFRNFCFSPQSILDPMLSDIDRLSVA